MQQLGGRKRADHKRSLGFRSQEGRSLFVPGTGARAPAAGAWPGRPARLDEGVQGDPLLRCRCSRPGQAVEGGGRSGLLLGHGEGLDLALQKDLDFLLGGLQGGLAVTGERDTALEGLQGLLQRQVPPLQALDQALELGQGLLEVGGSGVIACQGIAPYRRPSGIIARSSYTGVVTRVNGCCGAPARAVACAITGRQEAVRLRSRFS